MRKRRNPNLPGYHVRVDDVPACEAVGGQCGFFSREDAEKKRDQLAADYPGCSVAVADRPCDAWSAGRDDA